MEMTLDLLVADKLHADAILGVDALGAFGAVIDVAEKTLTLKRTEQVLALGVMIVHQSYLSKMAASIRLPPRGQALVIANVVGDAPEKATVLVEGSLGLPPTLCVARTEFWIRRGTVVASTSVFPESAFDFEVPSSKTPPPDTPEAAAPTQVAATTTVSPAKTLRPDAASSKVDDSAPPDQKVELGADFSESRLSPEQKDLF
ncbi:hypothetical protein PR002_g23056 [Phytophthora rubi]|uniref:Aspartic peptidase DDI1-type domain-containing protein n=1 Tax=Phytophthora rubi TaxID=129364 RepID=A0A6A3IPV0_9STRA|nr:hypothetical protein PR002_g23056 [Phytophthora rubi]